jgi:hypothetical protein
MNNLSAIQDPVCTQSVTGKPVTAVISFISVSVVGNALHLRTLKL